jgi:ABC-type lipopolysaccharide export system ATPase subunit
MIVGLVALRQRARSCSTTWTSPPCRCIGALRLGVGYLPQEASVFRKLTVEDNILAVLETGATWTASRGASAGGAARGAEYRPHPRSRWA